MSLTRKMLKAMGIEEEKIEQIIDAHTETVDALKAYKTDAEKLPAVQKELNDLKAKGDDGYKEKYENEHKAFEDFKAEVEQQKTTGAKENAFRAILKELGIADKRIESIIRVSDVKSMELDGDKLKDADKLTENLKNEWAEFIPTTQTKGAQTSNPPANNSGETDLGTLTMAEYIAARKKG